jgi:diguanylate cyclase (GGDEF)-like protein
MTELLSDECLPEAIALADNLPSLPSVALEVLRLCRAPDTRLEELTAVIAYDPALVAKIVRVANSSLFSPSQEITTLSRATMMLGLRTVELMALTFSLVEAVPEKRGGSFDLQSFWHRSLVAAVAGKSLARVLERRDGDEAFLCGLLGNIGRLVIAHCLPKLYDELLEKVGPWPSLEEEEQLLGFHHALVGGQLLKSWGLPAVLWMSISLKGRPELARKADQRTSDLVALTTLAELVSATVCDENKGQPMAALHGMAQTTFGMGPEAVGAFLADLEQGIAEAAEVLRIDLPPNTSHASILAAAQRQMISVSLSTAADLQTTKQQALDLESKNRELQTRVKFDPLTGLPNRAAFDAFLEEQLCHRARGGASGYLALLMIDIDHFKRVNDTLGHPAGDEILAAVGGVLANTTRAGDLAARYGGEEFAVVMPHSIPSGARSAAERLREAIAAKRVEIDGVLHSVTASIGVACVKQIRSLKDGKALIRLADECLYKAKHGGRNRCESVAAITCASA